MVRPGDTLRYACLNEREGVIFGEPKPMEELGNEVRPNNGVIITFYVESPALHFRDRKDRGKKKIKQNQRPKKLQPARSCGYDRRSQLLALAHELRKSDPPIPKHPDAKNQKWPEKPETQARRRVCRPNNSQSQWRYERVKKQVNTEKVDQPCCSKCFTGRNKDVIGVGESNSSFFRTLRVALKELAGRCKGNKEAEEKKALPMAHTSISSKAD